MAGRITSNDFYPRSPCGERRRNRFCPTCQWHFYPRSPCGERLNGIGLIIHVGRFLSTLSLRRATAADISRRRGASISIHALLAESDTARQATIAPVIHFYPRSPCGERRISSPSGVALVAFLSTLSLRRATCHFRLGLLQLGISIHALLAESDSGTTRSTMMWNIFLSTLSLRRATCNCVAHALGKIYFYPRSPCGERRIFQAGQRDRMDFYPRSPCGERHAGPRLCARQYHFYPRSPCGERPRHYPTMTPDEIFLSTLSLRRATVCRRLRRPASRYFYPRSPCGERRYRISAR